MTRERLMSEISASEFMEWMLLEAVEPWGQRRSDIHTGMICATLANIHRDPHRAAFQPADFINGYLPPFDEETEEQARALRIHRSMAGLKEAWNSRLQRRGELTHG
jgi:hypothetical protein